ncbi:MAG: thioredoxin family protein [Dehalobacterium sp.]
MSTIIMLVTNWCPHCKKALSWMEEVKAENPNYSKLDIRIIDEEREPETANKYDYYYVPTYFINDIKIHEGIPSKEIVREVFKKALKNDH